MEIEVRWSSPLPAEERFLRLLDDVEQGRFEAYRQDADKRRFLTGRVLANPPVLWDIESDPALAGTKMIAEAWDAAGLYQVGSFVGDSWKEWNGHFRDDVRDFFPGAPHSVSRVADRFVGSPAIYGHKEREAEQSVNFVTCHDGFTLHDLVAYNHKHNQDNGEGNHDGANDNRSWNTGVEGPTDDPAIQALRERQAKNYLTFTVLSLGIPMLLMGDEVLRTQRGNNNAYCQDNEISWFDWRLLEKHADIHRFASVLILRRLMRTSEHERLRLSLNEVICRAQKAWHGLMLHKPDWGDDSHCVGLTIRMRAESLLVHIMFNASWESKSFQLPQVSDDRPIAWRRWIDTFMESPHDIVDWKCASLLPGYTYLVESRSTVVLFSHEEPGKNIDETWKLT